MNASRAQHKHEPTMKALGLNGQITEDVCVHLGSIHFVFFQWQKKLGKLAKFYKSAEISENSIVLMFFKTYNSLFWFHFSDHVDTMQSR